MCVCVGRVVRHQGQNTRWKSTKQVVDVKNCMVWGSKLTSAHRNSSNLNPNTHPSIERTCECGNRGGEKKELRSNHFFAVLMVLQLQTWIIHLKCKNDWNWITYLDDSIWYGVKIRTDYIGSTLLRRILCEWAFAYSVESLQRVNPGHRSGTKTLWKYVGHEWGDAQMWTLCDLQRNCRTLVAFKRTPWENKSP